MADKPGPGIDRKYVDRFGYLLVCVFLNCAFRLKMLIHGVIIICEQNDEVVAVGKQFCVAR